MPTIAVKVVPGARVNRVVGKYGDAMKIQVSAPPEGGKANKAVIELLANILSIRPQQVRIVRGHTQPRKLIELDGVDPKQIQELIRR